MFIDLKTKISRKVARRIIVNTIRHLIYFRKENKDKTRRFLKGFLAALWKIDLLTTITDGKGHKIQVGAREGGTLITVNGKVIKDME